MRKTLIALMIAAALPTVAMAMPGGDGPMGPRHGGEHHGRGDAPYSQLDLTREQRQQIGKLMGEQMHERKQLVDKYLQKLPAADQKGLKDEIAAKHEKTQKIGQAVPQHGGTELRLVKFAAVPAFHHFFLTILPLAVRGIDATTANSFGTL